MASLDNPNGTTGALLQNDMYAWIAEGAGRVDLSAESDMQFDYAAVASKSKNKIINPLGHIQFAASLRQLRYMFCGDQGGGNGCSYTLSKYSERNEIDNVTDASLGSYILSTKTTTGSHNKNVDASACSKFLFAPYVDEFSLIPSMVADLSDATNKYNLEPYASGSDLSFSNTSYANITIAPEASGTVGTDFAIGSGLDTSTNLDEFNFQIVDISNYTVDGSFNIVAAFNIYIKYGPQNGGAYAGSDNIVTEVWPQTLVNLRNNSSDADEIKPQLPSIAASTDEYATDDTDNEALYFDKKDDSSFFMNGVPITVTGREIVKPIKVGDFTFSDYSLDSVSFGNNAVESARGGGSGNKGFEDVSYIAQVYYGDLKDMKFEAGVMTRNDNEFICIAGNQLVGLKERAVASSKTCAQQLKEEAKTLGIDVSYCARTLSDTSILKSNSDNWMGDILLPITGKAADASGGLQCVHVPDILKNIRSDAAASLAANFAGLSELVGSISVGQSNDVSYGEINRLSYQDISGQISSDGEDLSGIENVVNGCYTIPGHIITSKLKNFMMGSLDAVTGDSNVGVTSGKTNQHIFKAVYSVGGKQWWADGGVGDTSAACVARNIDTQIDNISGYTDVSVNTNGNGIVDVSCEIQELTPQESAFFYLYPWASTQMCAIGCGAAELGVNEPYYLDGELLDNNQNSADTNFPRPTNDLVAGSVNCNPFRQFAARYLSSSGQRAYGATMSGTILDGVKAAVPTAQGWWDICGGYYNPKKDRTEWYSFVDIDYSSNNNNVDQGYDNSYIYQNINDGTRGRYKLSVLDIVFPDICGNATDESQLAHINAGSGALDDTNPRNNDFCTLNFQIPLRSSDTSIQRRFDKVASLTGGNIQLANESYSIDSGFSAKCHATAPKLGVISANVTELLNAYMPVIVRIMDEETIGDGARS